MTRVHSGSEPADWMQLLQGVGHDVYHTPEYHRVTGLGNRGEPHVFSYCEDGERFIWPYLLSAIDGTDHTDVSSVYGYPGPVSNGHGEFLQRAWHALLDHWKQQRAVAAFTRFHPILGNVHLMNGLRNEAGESADAGCRPLGLTVAMDISIPADQQVRNYQKVLRQEIRKARESGFVTEEDLDWAHAEEFIRLYSETMARRNSRSDYLIDMAWLVDFRQRLGSHARLFVTRYEGRVAAALLAMEYQPFLHAHLTGINGELAAHSPLKVLLDGIREWGTDRGLKSFHLGGGVGGREDSLFQFKKKFSPVTHEFWTGSWVLDRPAYAELEAEHRRKYAAQGIEIGQPGFFPIYRYNP